jgi:hypothetical protein
MFNIYLKIATSPYSWNEISNKFIDPINLNRVKELESMEGPNIDLN